MDRSKKNNVCGFQAMFGCTHEALALFRISLGVLLVIELASRFRFLHPFYSDEGTLPLRLLLPKIDWIYKAVCLHTHLHELWQIQTVLGIQVAAAVLFTVGYQTKLMTVVSWYLYLSLTLRNTWLNFILDRYFHFLLFYAIFLPLDQCWSVSAWLQRRRSTNQQPMRELVVSPGTIALKLLVLWIYLDAGGGKYMDPLQGWTYNAKPLPALDTYTRHTVFARYVYGILGPEGLRAMTPTVVYVELLAAPLAFAGCYLGMPAMVNTAVITIWQLHVGIALCMNNAVLLSFVANTVWCIFLPVGWEKISEKPRKATTSKVALGTAFSAVMVLSMITGNIWFATSACDRSTMIFYSTIFHCRWNVFLGAEEYVTWEIAPGLLADGSVVDVWGQKEEVDWRLPGAGAPCTSTSRPGRWRSFPYLAELKGEDGEALWSYLCRQWDRDNNVEHFPDRKLIKFNFFMLQADVLPNMGFSATRKRLIQTFECGATTEEQSTLDNQEAQSTTPMVDTADLDTSSRTDPQQLANTKPNEMADPDGSDSGSDLVEEPGAKLDSSTQAGEGGAGSALPADPDGGKTDLKTTGMDETDGTMDPSDQGRDPVDSPRRGKTVDEL